MEALESGLDLRTIQYSVSEFLLSFRVGRWLFGLFQRNQTIVIYGMFITGIQRQNMTLTCWTSWVRLSRIYKGTLRLLLLQRECCRYGRDCQRCLASLRSSWETTFMRLGVTRQSSEETSDFCNSQPCQPINLHQWRKSFFERINSFPPNKNNKNNIKKC